MRLPLHNGLKALRMKFKNAEPVSGRFGGSAIRRRALKDGARARLPKFEFAEIQLVPWRK
jgi:hypothetical protein